MRERLSFTCLYRGTLPTTFLLLFITITGCSKNLDLVVCNGFNFPVKRVWLYKTNDGMEHSDTIGMAESATETTIKAALPVNLDTYHLRLYSGSELLREMSIKGEEVDKQTKNDEWHLSITDFSVTEK